METNLDSVLDRIRVLEQRMDEAPVQQVIVQQASGSAGEVNQSAVPEPEKTPEGCSGGSAEDCGRLEGDRGTDHSSL